MFTGPNIVTNGLEILLDNKNKKSYTGTGDAWTNLINKQSYSGSTLSNPSWANNVSQVTICVLLEKTETLIGYASHPVNKWNSGYTTNSSFVLYHFGDYSPETMQDGLLAWYGTTSANGWSQIAGGGYDYRMISGEIAHVCLQYNSNNGGGQMWINGQKIGARSGTTGTIGPAPDYGNISVYGPQASGAVKVHKASFYSRELTDSEILQNYNAIKHKVIRP
jgi:hypothetical protein